MVRDLVTLPNHPVYEQLVAWDMRSNQEKRCMGAVSREDIENRIRRLTCRTVVDRKCYHPLVGVDLEEDFRRPPGHKIEEEGERSAHGTR